MRRKTGRFVFNIIALFLVKAVAFAGIGYIFGWFVSGDAGVSPPIDCNDNDNGGFNYTREFLLASDTPWSYIGKLSESGYSREILYIGDEKDVELVTGEVLTFVLKGFYHDILSDDTGYAPMTWGMRHLMAEPRSFSAQTHMGGWAMSCSREWLNSYVYDLLPLDLREHIAAVDKLTHIGAHSASEIVVTSDRLWLFSLAEVLFINVDFHSVEGMQYEFFQTHTGSAVRVKRLANGAGSSFNWLLRSILFTNNASFWSFSAFGGSQNVDLADNPVGISFGFSI